MSERTRYAVRFFLAVMRGDDPMAVETDLPDRTAQRVRRELVVCGLLERDAPGKYSVAEAADHD